MHSCAATAAKKITPATAQKAFEQFLERVEALAAQGHRFRNLIEQEGCWYWEVFGFLKGRSRVIALADYSVEKTFILAAPHQFLIGEPEELAISAAVITPKPAVKKRRPRDCPF